MSTEESGIGGECMVTFDDLIFRGIYADLCKDFIAYKQSLGYKYEIRRCYAVKYMCDYLADNSSQKILTKELIEGFIKKRPNESTSTQVKRTYIIRQFALYLETLGYNVYLPPYDCIKKDKTFIPYIYTKDEISRIILESEKLKPVHQAPNSFLVYPMMLKILFGCGLRISEAINLKVKDVDIENGILKIYQSKYNNSRLIPLSDGLAESCKKYYTDIGHHFVSGEEYFFPVSPGVPYARGSVYNRFRYFLKNAGIVHGGRGKGPRLHDARHSYAVYALNNMVTQGIDIYCALPVISTYMGHRTIESTEKYVRLIPAFYVDIVNTMEGIYDGLFPEVADEK